MKTINQALEYMVSILASHTCTFVSIGSLYNPKPQLLIINY